MEICAVVRFRGILFLTRLSTTVSGRLVCQQDSKDALRKLTLGVKMLGCYAQHPFLMLIPPAGRVKMSLVRGVKNKSTFRQFDEKYSCLQPSTQSRLMKSCLLRESKSLHGAKISFFACGGTKAMLTPRKLHPMRVRLQ